MVGTHADFVWDISITPACVSPYAEQEVVVLVNSFKAAGLEVTTPEDGDYAWDFECKLPHLLMHCKLGLIGDKPVRWLLSFYPLRGLVNWWFDRWWEEEQSWLVRVVDGVLRKNSQVSGLRWYTTDRWMNEHDRVVG